ARRLGRSLHVRSSRRSSALAIWNRTRTQGGSHDFESLSRRSFVMTLAAAAAAPAAQAQAPAPGTSAAPAGGPQGREQRMLIGGAQIHIWKSSKPNPNHRQIADYSADDALKEMDEAGVTAAVIHPPGWDPNANALAVEAARQHPNRFAILGNFPLDRPES